MRPHTGINTHKTKRTGSELRSHGATGKCNNGPPRSLFMLSADRRGLDSAGERVSTHWVALISIEMGTLGPLRMSALIHTGLRILPASVSCRRRSREGPTALRLLKSSLMPAGKGQGLGNWTSTRWVERAGNGGWTALRANAEKKGSPLHPGGG